jgi:hypothetical protein
LANFKHADAVPTPSALSDCDRAMTSGSSAAAAAAAAAAEEEKEEEEEEEEVEAAAPEEAADVTDDFGAVWLK